MAEMLGASLALRGREIFPNKDEEGNTEEKVMLDIAFIRSHPDVVKEAARLKNNTIDIDALLALDQRVVAAQHEVEDLRAKQNQLS